MTDFVRIAIGLLFAFNVVALVVFTATRCAGHELPHNYVIAVIAVNIFVDALMFYVIF